MTQPEATLTNILEASLEGDVSGSRVASMTDAQREALIVTVAGYYERSPTRVSSGPYAFQTDVVSIPPRLYGIPHSVTYLQQLAEFLAADFGVLEQTRQRPDRHHAAGYRHTPGSGAWLRGRKYDGCHGCGHTPIPCAPGRE